MTKNLKKSLEEYLALRRSLGFKLHHEGNLLPKFIFFIEQEGAEFITCDLALRWATQPKDSKPVTRSLRLRMVRSFAKYLIGIDPRTEIPSSQLIPRSRHRPSPYIYSDNEIQKLIESAKQLPSKTGIKLHTFSTFLGLLAVTGMRLGEAVRLNNEDVDLVNGILTIRQTKFRKSRWLPIHLSTQQVLQQYAYKRDQVFPSLHTSSFFVSDKGMRLTQKAVRYSFIKISCQIGLRNPVKYYEKYGRGPRLHDLRHTFTVRTIINWYRENKDVEKEMPKLATYLGHTHVENTYWYISAIPELMQLAASRLENIVEFHQNE